MDIITGMVQGITIECYLLLIAIINNAASQFLKHRMTMMMMILCYVLSYLLTYPMEQRLS
jgi:hypothetical protein